MWPEIEMSKSGSLSLLTPPHSIPGCRLWRIIISDSDFYSVTRLVPVVTIVSDFLNKCFYSRRARVLFVTLALRKSFTYLLLCKREKIKQEYCSAVTPRGGHTHRNYLWNEPTQFNYSSFWHYMKVGTCCTKTWGCTVKMYWAVRRCLVIDKNDYNYGILLIADKLFLDWLTDFIEHSCSLKAE